MLFYFDALLIKCNKVREGHAGKGSEHERVDLVARGVMVVDEVLDVGKDKFTRIELR